MTEPTYVVYEEFRCKECNGIGRRLTDKWHSLAANFAVLVDHIRQDTINQAVVEQRIRGFYLTRVLDAEASCTTLCQGCWGKGKVLKPATLTRGVLESILSEQRN